jgi:hypothetical protein
MSLSPNIWPDVRAVKAHDTIRDASAVCVIENALLAHQLTDDQQLLVVMTSGGQMPATTSDQGINTYQIPLQVAKLLLDGLADLVDTWLLFLGNGQKLLPRFPAVSTWLMTKAFSDLRMHRIDKDLSDFPGFIEK